MPRFVVLEHDHPVLHWDLMLESGDTLRTWRLSVPPTAGSVVTATELPDHRRYYLDYEGPVGGGRGCVVRWDAGTYEMLGEEEGLVRFRTAGARFNGSRVLEKNESGSWRLFADTDGV